MSIATTALNGKQWIYWLMWITGNTNKAQQFCLYGICQSRLIMLCITVTDAFFTNVSFVNATLKYSKCVNYCNLWCKPQELPCPETSRLNRLHQQLINKHVASLDRVIQGYAAYGFRHLFRHSLKVTAVFRIDWYLQWQSQMLPFVLLDYPFFIHMFR